METKTDSYNQLVRGFTESILKLMGILIGLVFLLELIFYFIFTSVDETSIDFPSDFPEYFLKYMLLPLVINLCGLLIALFVYRRERQQQEGQVMRAPFIVLIAVCFSVHLVHIPFHVLVMTFVIPPLLSVFYGSVSFTGGVTIASAAARVLAYFLSRYVSAEDFAYYRGMNTVRIYNMFIFFVLMGVVFFICMLMLRTERARRRTWTKWQDENRKLLMDTLIDPLTGLFNRKGLRLAFDDMKEHPGTSGTMAEYVLIILDVDNFKGINDTFGHQTGDLILTNLAHALQEGLRSDEPHAAEHTRFLAEGSIGSIYRYGGDEFVVLLHGDKRTTEKICKNVAELFAAALTDEQRQMTGLSFGAAIWDGTTPVNDFFHHADEALYVAKKEKGRLCFYGDKD